MDKLTEKEQQSRERKSAWNDKHLKAVAAFANTGGGFIIIGEDDDGKVMGVNNSEKLLEDLPNKIKSKLGIIPLVELAEKDGKDVIRITVKPSVHPVSCNGKYYIRSGSTVQQVSGMELTRFLLARTGKSWDALPSDAGIEEIDPETFERFLKLAKDRLPEISATDTTEKILRNLDLVDGEKLTNAAVLLFAERPQRHIINAGARVGRFKTSIDILDTVEAFGNLFVQLERLLEAIKKHLNVEFKIKGVVREDVWDYPLEALREGVINALIHRDYLSTADIQIKIFDDKVKIWNPGKLPAELSVEDLKGDHGSIPRNKLLAYAFYYAGLIEKWGSGTNRIVDLCLSQDLPEPEFREETGGLALYFHKDIYREELLKERGLNDRQVKAVMYVKEKGSITNKEYQELNSTIKRTATRDLNDLIERRIIRRVGKTGKGTYYKLRGHKGDI